MDKFAFLGNEVKESIVNRVSGRCMVAPGMNQGELRIAVAEEIANCNEWRASFKSVDFLEENI